MTSSAHYLNVDESDQTSENSSLISINNDQRALLSSGSIADQIGKLTFFSQLYSHSPSTSPLLSFNVEQNLSWAEKYFSLHTES